MLKIIVYRLSRWLYLIKNELNEQNKNYRKLHRIFLKATADNEQTKHEEEKKVIIKCISMNVTDIRNYIYFVFSFRSCVCFFFSNYKKI